MVCDCDRKISTTPILQTSSNNMFFSTFQNTANFIFGSTLTIENTCFIDSDFIGSGPVQSFNGAEITRLEITVPSTTIYSVSLLSRLRDSLRPRRTKPVSTTIKSPVLLISMIHFSRRLLLRLLGRAPLRLHQRYRQWTYLQ
jgi:hypothetical protein